MSIKKNKNELHAHKRKVLLSLQTYFDDLIESDNISSNNKADKVCYWLETYVRYLKKESSFNPRSLKRYKRGDIVKVDFGFRIDSEFGGLHYAVVLTRKDTIGSHTITVLPLTSLKENKLEKGLNRNELAIGNEVYESLLKKMLNRNDETKKNEDELEEVNFALSYRESMLDDQNSQFFEKYTDPETHQIVDDVDENDLKALLNSYYELEAINEERKVLIKKLKLIKNDLEMIEKMLKELDKMKSNGSIVLLSQILTISKMRIHDPKKSHDILSDIRLSKDTMDKIDNSLINVIFIK